MKRVSLLRVQAGWAGTCVAEAGGALAAGARWLPPFVQVPFF